MFQGSIVALVTPMLEDGSLDMQSMSDLVDFHVDNGSDALVAVGTTGESATLNEEEHCYVIEKVVEFSAGRIPIIAGTGANSTTEAIDLTRCAQKVGADACLLVTPYYNKPTQEGLYLHHKHIAETVDIPQILYNVPGRTSVDMLPETVLRLADIDNIVAIKEATGDMDRFRVLVDQCGDKISILSGDDATALDSMLIGGKGDISVTANIAPQPMHDMCQAALDGDEKRARSINEKLMPLHNNLFLESNPIPVKWALAEMQKVKPGIRLPLTWFDQQHQEKLKQVMQQAGVLS